MTSTSGLVQSGTRTFVVGQVSGIDTSALVELAVQAKTQKADQIDVNIEENTAKTAAYSELQTLAQSFQDSMDRLKSPGTLFDTTESIFDTRSGTISTNDGTNPSGILSVAIDDAAPTGTFNIEIIQQALAHKVASNAYADQTTDLGHTGSFNIGLAGGGATAAINVTADMSLQELAAAINNESETTGVSATVLKVSETSFQMVLTANSEALDIEITGIAGDDVMDLTGVKTGAVYNNILQSAQEAIIELDNVEVRRNSNDFDDLITGVNLSIQNESPGTVFTLQVDNDLSSVKSEIESMIEAYNTLRDFITTQSNVSEDGVVSSSSILFSDNLMDTMDLFVNNILTSSNGSGTFSSLRDLGIELDGNLKLSIQDSTALDDALINNLDDVKNFFGSTYTSDNSSLALLGNTSSQPSASFALDITVDGSGDITGASVGGDASLFTFTGTSIIGAEGGIYEGLRFSYIGGVNTTVNVDIQQGLATRLDNVLDLYSRTTSDGIIQQERVRLETENETLEVEAARIREIGEEVRTREIDRYAQMEAALQANELLVRQIKALFGTDDSDN